MSRVHLSPRDVQLATAALVRRNERAPVYGVPRGGLVPAAMVAGHWHVPLLDEPEPGCLVVDDLIDSGATRERFAEFRFDALYRKSYSPAGDQQLLDGWLVFPWESSDDGAGAEDSYTRLLQVAGEDPTRDGLADTPARAARAWSELTAGYTATPDLRTFEANGYDEIVAVSRIPFYSLCEHHLLPFHGYAAIAYLPGRRILGLSKFARLVDLYARRLQVQERLTQQIADHLVDALEPRGVAVLLEAEHLCMTMRGVQKPGAHTRTSVMRGAFRDKPEARAEALRLLA